MKIQLTMKKILFALLLLATVGAFVSCEQEEIIVDDDVLIEEIATATHKASVEPEDLPDEINAHVEESFFDTYVETAQLIEDKGYEVQMGNGDLLYFDKNNRRLIGRRLRSICRRVARARPVDVNNIPQPIVDFVSNNFNGAQIVRARYTHNDNLLVALDNHVILRFDINNQFVEEVSWLRHCANLARPLPLDQIPAPIVNAIGNNFPNANIVRAATKGDNYLIGLVAGNGDRKILIFDNNGQLIGVRG